MAGTMFDSSIEVALQGKDFQATPRDANVRSVFSGLLTADWIQSFIARGFGWHIDTVASFATPIQGGGAGTAYDQDQPEMCISVPTNFVLVPLRIQIAVNPAVLAADDEVTEAAIMLDRSAAYAGDGTVVTETPVNLRTNKTGGCAATCFSAATGNITNPTMSAILATKTLRGNFGTAVGMGLYGIDLLYEPDQPPLILGPAAIYGYWGGTVAATGYGMADFLVIPSELVTNVAIQGS